MRIAFTTLGCRLNQFETDAMVRAAQEAGHQAVGFREPADVVVINSCTITHEADADTRQRVRQAMRRNPDARIAVTGCYANAAPEEVAALPGVSLVFGNREKDQLPRWLATPKTTAAPVLIPPVDLTRRVRLAALKPATDSGRSRAYLKIQDGCNYRCSFCIVPRVRGRSASLAPATVLTQL
ncbi:MAG: tRNA (N(6)-L-threonylcarbamoyladenosine(37)-C(2))-methylthiotransferase MtaB, partial [Nannocystaceae bacterium]